MKKFLIFLLLFYSAFSDEIYIYQDKSADYVQLEEFLVADGSSILGPIKLLPLAITRYLKIEPASKNIKIQTILLEEVSTDWKENIIGKNISIEGEGRFVRGKVKSIDGKFIVIDTSRGTIITTLPDFPEKITSILKWDELFSPYVMIKINSSFSGNSVFKIKYQVAGITWEPQYIYDKNKSILEYFIKVKNNTNIAFNEVNLIIKDKNKTVIKLDKVNLEAKSMRIFKVKDIPLKNGKMQSTIYLPDGDVAVYNDSRLESIKSLKSFRK